jgi:hypothetical protein
MTPSQEGNDVADRPWLRNIKDVVAIGGGITAVVVALLWAIGRQYVKGYYATVNIPSFQDNLTLWDYGEKGWSFLLIGILVSSALVYAIYSLRGIAPKIGKSTFAFVLGYAIALVLFFTALIIMLTIQTGFEKDSTEIARVLIALAAYSMAVLVAATLFLTTARNHQAIELSAAIFLTIAVFVAMLVIAYDRGANSGRNYTPQQARKVRVILTAPLLVGAPATIGTSTEGNELVNYEDFYLMMYNDGRYFLFREIGPNCRPTQVYVVKEADVRSISFFDLDSPRLECTSPAPSVQPSPLDP